MEELFTVCWLQWSESLMLYYQSEHAWRSNQASASLCEPWVADRWYSAPAHRAHCRAVHWGRRQSATQSAALRTGVLMFIHLRKKGQTWTNVKYPGSQHASAGAGQSACCLLDGVAPSLLMASLKQPRVGVSFTPSTTQSFHLVPRNPSHPSHSHPDSDLPRTSSRVTRRSLPVIKLTCVITAL